MKIYFLLALSAAHFSHAEVEQITTTADGGIHLKASSCESLSRQIAILEQWTQYAEGRQCARPQPDSEYAYVDRSCSANIAPCLPEHVRKYHGARPEVAGPNCWNFALVLSGVLPALRHSIDDEITFYLDSPLCRPLTRGENRRPGDIGTIRNDKNEEVHGFVYISDELVYSKNGSSKLRPYALQKASYMYTTYGLTFAKKSCLSNQRPLECEKGTDFYRCISMQEYLNQANTSAELKQALARLNQVECLTSAMSFGKNLLHKPGVQSLFDMSEVLSEYLASEQEKKGPRTQEDWFFLGSLKLRLHSIAVQLGELSHEVRSSEDQLRMKSLIEQVKKSYQSL